jgi:beta-glucosidase
VVQVYLAPDAPAADRPSRWLAGFASVQAGAGETVEAVVELPRRAVEAWEGGGWVTLSGGYTVDVGHDYGDTRLSAALKV